MYMHHDTRWPRGALLQGIIKFFSLVFLTFICFYYEEDLLKENIARHRRS